jgi:hypothetical protein
MSKVAALLSLALMAALVACDDKPTLVPGIEESCTWRYQMEGTSEANAKYYDAKGAEVREMSIEADPEKCSSGVAVVLTHKDKGARLMDPRGTCVTETEGVNTHEVWFKHKLSCECDDAWDWITTDKSPPATIKVVIRPVAGCNGG